MLECYSAAHSETLEELLEWPYRRMIQAFSDWQKRNAVDEIENRKNLHVAAYQGIVEWKEEGDQSEAIESVEKYYEILKDLVWNPELAEQENREMREIESNDPFLSAGKRNLAKVTPFELPNQEEIEDTLS